MDTLCRALVEINLAVRFDLAMMDGILALEGGGSESGRPKKAGVILASRDLVALDSVAAKVMGMEPSAVPTNKVGKEYGLGEDNLSRIEIRGDSLEDCLHTFLPPGRELKKIPLVAYLMYHFRQKSIKPLILDSACTRCRRCEGVCPVGAIEMEPVPHLKESCINCFCCYENCPEKAIGLSTSWYLRPVVRRRLAGLSASSLSKV